ncbi:unnamed protein product [Rotaria sordida]|uniref:Uncharacterized protein n=1 Tax=Rotaria sordida TaxID=392033 RepID=A0A814MFB6_9BILA|nr:unnamed protein product [Rotaria sordida]CAF3800464.1 unnamed protein product [Rotaria sordida]
MNLTCVRLTYSIDVTRSSSLAVYRSLLRLNVILALKGFIENNPLLINKSISYCCNEFDGNGFWGDRYFDVEQWIDGLIFMAKKTINRPYIIGMSLRNELRGLRQNLPEWYDYVLRGIGEAISSINSRLLIIISDLNYDLDLSFIRLLSI